MHDTIVFSIVSISVFLILPYCLSKIMTSKKKYCYITFKLNNKMYQRAIHSTIRSDCPDAEIEVSDGEIVAKMKYLDKYDNYRGIFDKINFKYKPYIKCSCYTVKREE